LKDRYGRWTPDVLNIVVREYGRSYTRAFNRGSDLLSELPRVVYEDDKISIDMRLVFIEHHMWRWISAHQSKKGNNRSIQKYMSLMPDSAKNLLNINTDTILKYMNIVLNSELGKITSNNEKSLIYINQRRMYTINKFALVANIHRAFSDTYWKYISSEDLVKK